MSVGPISQEEAMESPIPVIGGTGTLGQQVVPRLRHAGYDVRVLSWPSYRVAEGIELVTGDLATGEGIEAAVAGTEIVLHLADSAEGDEVKAAHPVRRRHRPGWTSSPTSRRAPNRLRCAVEPPAWKELASVIVGVRPHHALDLAAASCRHRWSSDHPRRGLLRPGAQRVLRRHPPPTDPRDVSQVVSLARTAWVQTGLTGSPVPHIPPLTYGGVVAAVALLGWLATVIPTRVPLRAAPAEAIGMRE
jgi:NAD dependent epimerase/dehydratase family